METARLRIFIGVIVTIFILGSCSNKEYDDAMEKGKKAIESHDYEEAITYFEKALEQKEGDDEATTHINQLNNTIQGLEHFDEGKLTEAEAEFQQVIDRNKDGSTTLISEAEEKVAEIKQLVKVSETTASIIEKIEGYYEKGEFKKAQSLLKDLEETDFTHPYLSELEAELEALNKEVKQAKKKNEKVKAKYDDLQALVDNKQYDEANTLVEEILAEDLAALGLKSLKEEVESMKQTIQTAQEEQAKKEQEQQIVDDIQGYWATEPPYDDFLGGTDICKITTSELKCATMNSDNFFGVRIDSFSTEGDNIVKAKTTEGDEFEIGVTNQNEIRLFEEKYERITKEFENRLLTEYPDSGDTIEEFYQDIFSYIEL